MNSAICQLLFPPFGTTPFNGVGELVLTFASLPSNFRSMWSDFVNYGVCRLLLHHFAAQLIGVGVVLFLAALYSAPFLFGCVGLCIYAVLYLLTTISWALNSVEHYTTSHRLFLDAQALHNAEQQLFQDQADFVDQYPYVPSAAEFRRLANLRRRIPALLDRFYKFDVGA